jgi:hypothetical protein
MGLSAFGSALVLLLSLAPRLRAQTAADWQVASHQIVRLTPSAFPELPVVVRHELERRNCRIPQLGPAFGSQRSNVVSGHFARPGQRDWAVLCSRSDSSQVLLFWNGRTTDVKAWEPTADGSWLQSMGPGGIQYSQHLAVADSAAIVTYAREYGGQLPPGPITHDGLEMGFAAKASSIAYWFNGRWYTLQGAD